MSFHSRRVQLPAQGATFNPRAREFAPQNPSGGATRVQLPVRGPTLNPRGRAFPPQNPSNGAAHSPAPSSLIPHNRGTQQIRPPPGLSTRQPYSEESSEEVLSRNTPGLLSIQCPNYDENSYGWPPRCCPSHGLNFDRNFEQHMMDCRNFVASTNKGNVSGSQGRPHEVPATGSRRNGGNVEKTNAYLPRASTNPFNFTHPQLWKRNDGTVGGYVVNNAVKRHIPLGPMNIPTRPRRRSSLISNDDAPYDRLLEAGADLRTRNIPVQEFLKFNAMQKKESLQENRVAFEKEKMRMANERDILNWAEMATEAERPNETADASGADVNARISPLSEMTEVEGIAYEYLSRVLPTVHSEAMSRAPVGNPYLASVSFH